MSGTDRTLSLIDRVNKGRESAAFDVDRDYRQRLCALVERELGNRFSSRIGAEDVVQPAFRSFFRGIEEKGWTIDSKQALWALLVRITLRKTQKAIERELARKRHPDIEVPGEDVLLRSLEPQPDDAVEVSDLIEKVLEGLEPPDPEIFRLQLEGHTQAEIAELTDCTNDRVRTSIDRILNVRRRHRPPRRELTYLKGIAASASSKERFLGRRVAYAGVRHRMHRATCRFLRR